jgi:DNA invertase Pin-like site-specific DNA recombinase
METQIQMCTDYLQQQFPGCIIKIYDKDYGITGHSIKKRKDFQRMMDDVRAGTINVVAIQRYDRIARNTRDFCNIYHDMEKVGCELVSVSQRIDTSTPYGKKFMYDLASTAELEWALNSERHKDTNKYARLNKKCALSPYALPFGIKAEIRDGKRVAVIDKEVEHIVRDAIAYYKKSESKMATTRYINEKYGLEKSHSFMTTLCNSDFYHGSYREVDGYCEAYMTKEEHEELRKISKRYVRHYSSDRNYFIFTGLLRCPVCGLKMESQSQINTSGNRYYYYRCYDTYRTGKCTFKGNVNEKYVEKYLCENVQAFLREVSVAHDKIYKQENKVVDLAKYKAEMERLTNAYVKGRIEESYYDKEYERIQKLIQQHETDNESQSKLDAAEIDKIFHADWLNAYNELSRKNKRAFWQNIIKQITFNADKTVKTVDFL